MMDQIFDRVGFYPADILLPRRRYQEKWPVVACDQFTSQPEYWDTLDREVGDAPSALRLILPESALNADGVEEKIDSIHATMDRYLSEDVFRTFEESMIYVRRTQSDGRVRQGLVGRIDLERYDFSVGSGALIRATEGTVMDRLPPRVQVRRGAALELPHVMLLIDDPACRVIEPLGEFRNAMEQVYDLPLMGGGGRLAGWRLTDVQSRAAAARMASLLDPNQITEKYGMPGIPPLLFAVGDGNHSLAAAKQCYEQAKRDLPRSEWMSLPSRWALVEVVNLHDAALSFEPIHRVLFGVEPQDVLAAFCAAYPTAYEGEGPGHTIEFYWDEGMAYLTVPDPRFQLAAGTLQSMLDNYCMTNICNIDYVHGDAVARALGRRSGNLACLLPPMEKSELFKTVMADGVLPRKTFSMGHAQDKRYYMEARRIR